MAAIKFLATLFLFLIPLSMLGQKSIYPKDTIYLYYKDTIFVNPNMKSKSVHKYNNDSGIKFWWKGKWLFHNNSHNTDTLCINYLKDYKFSNLEEIEEKRNKWIFDNKRPPANRNGVFKTYLIEVISKKRFVVYPVIWRNDGSID